MYLSCRQAGHAACSAYRRRLAYSSAQRALSGPQCAVPTFLVRSVPDGKGEPTPPEDSDKKRKERDAEFVSSLTDKQREQLSQLTAEDEAALARELASIWGIWAKAKEAVKSSQALPEESLKLLDEFTLEDAADEARSEKFQKELQESFLSPIRDMLGLPEGTDMLAVVVEILQVAVLLQFITCGLLFYGCQNAGHLDQGDSFRAAGGLAFGYATRVAVPIGDLLVPFYNACLDWFSRLQGNAGHVPFEDKPAGEKQAAVNRIGIATAVAFLVPQLLFHWDSTDTLQFVLPMSLGWFVSDPLFVAAIYLWVQRTEDEQQR